MVKTIFVYLVLFATLMMTIGGSVGAFMALADYVSPQPFYQSFDDYKQMRLIQKGNEIEGHEQSTALDEEILKVEYEQRVAFELERQKKQGLNRLIKSFGWIVIPLPVFLYYQRRLKD